VLPEIEVGDCSSTLNSTSHVGSFTAKSTETAVELVLSCGDRTIISGGCVSVGLSFCGVYFCMVLRIINCFCDWFLTHTMPSKAFSVYSPGRTTI